MCTVQSTEIKPVTFSSACNQNGLHSQTQIRIKIKFKLVNEIYLNDSFKNLTVTSDLGARGGAVG